MNDNIKTGEPVEEPAASEPRREPPVAETKPGDPPAERSAEAATPAASPAGAGAGYEPPPRHDPAPPPKPKGRGLAALALLVALGAAGAVAWLWWEDQNRDRASAQAVERLSGALAAADGRIGEQERRLAAAGEGEQERRQAITRLAGALERVEGRLENVAAQAERAEAAAREAPPEQEPVLADVEYLLQIANRELALADNPSVALVALRQADRRLADVAAPGLAPVRTALNDEIAALEAVDAASLEDIALRLGSLARRVEGLPLKGSLAPEPDGEAAAREGESGWQRFKRRLGELASSLFRVRRSDAPAAPLLAPEESFFLHRNVELDLKAARLAALSRDQENYTQSLAAARDALQSWFATQDPSVQAMLEAIAELGSREVAPEWPDISRSLELLRDRAEGD